MQTFLKNFTIDNKVFLAVKFLKIFLVKFSEKNICM